MAAAPPRRRRLAGGFLARASALRLPPGGPAFRLFRWRRVRRQQRDARCDGEGREPAGVRAGAGRLPQEVGEAEGARVGGHGEVGQAQGAGALRRELVLHAGGLHRPAPLPAGRRRGGLHGHGVRGAAAPRRPAQSLQPRLRQRRPPRPAGAGGAQDGGEGSGRRPQADAAGAAGPGPHRRAGRCC
ncbi:small ribosomal subunit protein eS19 isoform X1 [Larus michahellis]|uniref:small ribosomal subunit protein eS19 isoform X1 n=1 Tax=Larus michahellis TaxID=119627 RepID=UPI003D9B76DE